jgi:hypothetical protein
VARWRKKPIVVDAIQVHTVAEAVTWIRAHGGRAHAAPLMRCGLVETSDGELRFRTGDYLIQGVAGEIYPCQAKVFEQTYEVVADA